MSATDTVDVFELRYTKAEMAAAPEAERMFYLMVTSLANDIQILLRQYVIAIKQDDTDQAARNASSAVAMLNLRLLAGRFHEGWVFVDQRWPGLEASYAPQMSGRGIQALEGMRSHFAVSRSDNIVFMIRNKIGFHGDYGFARAMFAETPDDTPMIDYIGAAVGDTLFFGSEVTHYATLRRLTGESDDVRAFGAVMDELRTLQGYFLAFANAFVAVFARRNLEQQYLQLMSRRRTLTALPALERMRIPYFADFSASVAAVGQGESGKADPDGSKVG